MIHTLGLGGLGLRRASGGGIVAAALKMNGSDGSTTFTDETGKTWTASGNAQIDTAQSKFGGASGLFDGTTDYISTPDHEDFEFAQLPWTIEGWVRPASFAAFGGLVSKRTTSSLTFSPFYVYVAQTTGKLGLLCADDNTAWDVNFTSSNNFTLNTWSHFAAVRYGNTFQVFIDGTSGGTATFSGSLLNNTSAVAIGAGAANGDFSLNGHIDDVRITKGIAKYTANFTPPTVEQSYP